MEVGVGLRGVSQDQDTRYSNKDLRLLRTTKFPPEFNQKVDMRKVELEVMKPWIAKTVNTLLGFEDEVVIEYVSGLLEDEKDPIIDPKKMQVSLTGFLESKTPEFMAELWRLLLSAQASPLRVPPEFIEQKKVEMRARQEKEEKAIARRQEETVRDQQIEVIRQRERRERRDQQGDGYQRRPPARDFGGDTRGYSNGRNEDEREPQRQRRRFESPPRDRRPPGRSYSPGEARRGRSRSRSPPVRSSPNLPSHVSPSPPPPRRRRRSSTPPRRRYSPSPEPRRRRRDSRSISPGPRQRRRSFSRSPPRRRYESGNGRRRHDRSLSPKPRVRRRDSTPLQRDRNGTPDELQRDRWDDAGEETARIETLEDKEAELRAQMHRRKVEASIRPRPLSPSSHARHPDLVLGCGSLHELPFVELLILSRGMQSVNRFLYGPTPEERVRKWQAEMQKESRRLDREIRQIDAATKKAQGQLKQLAKKGETKNARILAKEVVKSRRQKDRLHTSQAQLNSIKMQLQHQLATLKITGTLQKSTEIMKLSNSLIRLPELTKTMQAMSQEMMKAGIMTEMVDDTMDMLDNDAEEIDEEADAEVDKVLWELTEGKLGQAGKVGTTLPTPVAPEAVEEDDEAETERMQAQLDSLLRG